MSNPGEIAQALEHVRASLIAAAGALITAQTKLHEAWEAHGEVSRGTDDPEYQSSTSGIQEAHLQLGQEAVPHISRAEQNIANYIVSLVASAAAGGINVDYQPLPPLNDSSKEPSQNKEDANSPLPSPSPTPPPPPGGSSRKEDKKQKRIESSAEADINAQVIKDIADDFGELTEESAARLPQSEPVSETRLSIRRERLESIAGKQAQQLFEVMDTLISNSKALEGVSRAEILANSYGVARSFALLANAEKKPDGHNEVTVIKAIQDNPTEWLQVDSHNKRLILTAEGRAKLQAAYISEGGCPAIGLRVTNDGGATSSDLFVLYWGMLASRSHR